MEPCATMKLNNRKVVQYVKSDWSVLHSKLKSYMLEVGIMKSVKRTNTHTHTRIFIHTYRGILEFCFNGDQIKKWWQPGHLPWRYKMLEPFLHTLESYTLGTLIPFELCLDGEFLDIRCFRNTKIIQLMLGRWFFSSTGALLQTEINHLRTDLKFTSARKCFFVISYPQYFCLKKKKFHYQDIYIFVFLMNPQKSLTAP